MRDEEMALVTYCVTGSCRRSEIGEEFNETASKVGGHHCRTAACPQNQTNATDLGWWWCASIWRNTRARVIFDVARIVYRSSGTSWRSASRFHRTPNGSRLMITEPRYRRMSLTNIEQVMPVKLSAQRWRIRYFRRWIAHITFPPPLLG